MIYTKKKTIIFFVLLILISLLSIFTFDFLKKKRERKSNEVRITFHEGMNIHEVGNLLELNGIIKKKDFFEACDSTLLKEEFDFLKNEPKNKYFALEGYLFPDTYDFIKGEDPILVVRKFLNNFKLKTKNLNIPQGFTLDQILTIASILEAESNMKSSKDVASVICNRLGTIKTNGKNKFGEYGLNFLQLDSTIYYPYRSKEEAPANFKSTYNTYEIKGFPPGPICSPGMKFIDDATNPNKTDYFYFCNDKNGDIYFAKTYAEHVKNLKMLGIRN